MEKKRASNLTEKIKSKPFFRPFDVILFGVSLAIIVILLFLFVIFPVFNNGTRGFDVYVGNTVAFSYEYEKDFIVSEEFSDRVIIDKENHTIKIFTDKDKTKYNLIKYDDQKRSVCVTEANCPNKDCTKMEGNVYCAPHGLKIIPLGEKTSPTVG